MEEVGVIAGEVQGIRGDLDDAVEQALGRAYAPGELIGRLAGSRALAGAAHERAAVPLPLKPEERGVGHVDRGRRVAGAADRHVAVAIDDLDRLDLLQEIGRASCRERVCQYV